MTEPEPDPPPPNMARVLAELASDLEQFVAKLRALAHILGHETHQ